MNGSSIARLTEALYRVTDLMPDTEPLKWSLRKQALAIRERFLSGTTGQTTLKVRLESKNHIVSLADDLIGLLEIASATTLLSRVNFDVLAREYALIKDIIRVEDEPIVLTDGFSSRALPRLQEAETQIVKPETIISQKERLPSVTTATQSVQGGGEIHRRVAVSSAPFSSSQSHQNSGFTGERTERIMVFLREHPWASRGDIFTIFGKKISTKTIQRDLTDLLAGGRIKKEGEKRWCKYHVVGN